MKYVHSPLARLLLCTVALLISAATSAGEEIIQLNPGHNGNWWGGITRNGEGGQFEIASDGDGGRVFVATIYSYGPNSGQIFLVAVGPVNDLFTEVEVFITGGGQWGSNFDPNDVMESQWGTGTFVAVGCDMVSMSLSPNDQYQDLGYTGLAYDMVRLTTSLLPCPFPE